MKEQIADSELILNKDGSIYHLNLKPEDIAETIVLVGDPDRVSRVSNYFDSVEIKKQKREFVTHTGYLNNKRISVLSTGIGGDNIDIVLQELDALVNIDLQERRVKKSFKSLNLIRLGTCGSFREDIPVDSIVLSSMAVGLDGLTRFYTIDEDAESFFLSSSIQKHFSGFGIETLAYSASADSSLLTLFSELDNYKGLTLTLGGFYGPQGRRIRLDLRNRSYEEMIRTFEFNSDKIMNLEMETSAIYAMAEALGHRALSISTVIANRASRTFSSDGHSAVEKMISDYIESISLNI